MNYEILIAIIQHNIRLVASKHYSTESIHIATLTNPKKKSANICTLLSIKMSDYPTHFDGPGAITQKQTNMKQPMKTSTGVTSV